MSAEQIQSSPESIFFQVPPPLAVDSLKAFLLRKTVRSNGIWLIVWGVINAFVGFMSKGASDLNLLLIPLGALMVIAGVYGVGAKNKNAYILQGVTIAVTAGWNIALSAAGWAENPIRSAFWSIFLLFWMYKLFAQGHELHFLTQRLTEVPGDVLGVLDAEAEQISKKAGSARVDLVNVKVESFVSAVWKLLIGRDCVAFVALSKPDIIFFDRATLAPIVLSVPEKPRGSVVCKIPLEDKPRKCTFKASDFAALRLWVQQASVCLHAAAAHPSSGPGSDPFA